MLRFGVLLLLIVGALAASAPAATPPLNGVVGPGFAISLKDADGALITRLDPGTYTIHVNDQSEMHNFHLTGPGIDKATGIDEIGTQDWEIVLTDGTYRYQCDPHSITMRGTFTVGAVTPPPPPPTLTLAGSVGPGKQIAFVRTAKAGKAIITVRDRTSKDNFHLIGPGVNKKTGVAFKGVVKWTVTLRAGTYVVKSDAHRTLKRTLKVT